APHPADAVHRDRDDRVVDPPPVEEQHREDHHRAGDPPDDDGGAGHDVRAPGGDADQTGQRAVRGHRQIGLLQREPRRGEARPGATLAHPAVMPTRPASAPFIDIVNSGFFRWSHDVTIAARAPAAAERFVFTAIRPMSTPAPVVLPALKPNQPNQRMNMPIVASTRLWPGIAPAVPARP